MLNKSGVSQTDQLHGQSHLVSECNKKTENGTESGEDNGYLGYHRAAHLQNLHLGMPSVILSPDSPSPSRWELCEPSLISPDLSARRCSNPPSSGALVFAEMEARAESGMTSDSDESIVVLSMPKDDLASEGACQTPEPGKVTRSKRKLL